jgi:hypothetical protein
MAALTYSRFKIDPADTQELIGRRNTLVDAVRKAVPGLLQARLAKIDDENWIDVWHWDSPASVQVAGELARTGNLPEAPPAFALLKDLTREDAEVVDER